jgi:hypothetical protein
MMLMLAVGAATLCCGQAQTQAPTIAPVTPTPSRAPTALTQAPVPPKNGETYVATPMSLYLCRSVAVNLACDVDTHPQSTHQASSHTITNCHTTALPTSCFDDPTHKA